MLILYPGGIRNSALVVVPPLHIKDSQESPPMDGWMGGEEARYTWQDFQGKTLFTVENLHGGIMHGQTRPSLREACSVLARNT